MCGRSIAAPSFTSAPKDTPAFLDRARHPDIDLAAMVMRKAPENN
jgi:hypothetical protein